MIDKLTQTRLVVFESLYLSFVIVFNTPEMAHLKIVWDRTQAWRGLKTDVRFKLSINIRFIPHREHIEFSLQIPSD